MPTWPVNIPFRVIKGTLRSSLAAGHYEFSPDAGAPQRRRSASAVRETVSFEIILDDMVQKVAVERFYLDACSAGVSGFDAPDVSAAGETATYWWEEPPSFADAGRLKFRARLKWGRLK